MSTAACSLFIDNQLEAQGEPALMRSVEIMVALVLTSTVPASRFALQANRGLPTARRSRPRKSSCSSRSSWRRRPTSGYRRRCERGARAPRRRSRRRCLLHRCRRWWLRVLRSLIRAYVRLQALSDKRVCSAFIDSQLATNAGSGQPEAAPYQSPMPLTASEPPAYESPTPPAHVQPPGKFQEEEIPF